MKAKPVIKAEKYLFLVPLPSSNAKRSSKANLMLIVKSET
jgi:hypothetical protein